MTRTIRRRVRRQKAGPISRPATTIIVPVLNESDNILPLIKRVRKAVGARKVELLFIDDSADKKTVEQVSLAKKTYRKPTFQIRIYHRKGAKQWGGLSGSVVDGITKARNDQIIIMDGDLQHPPETLKDMIKAADSGDVVIASRYCNGGSAAGLDGGIRRFVSLGSTWLAKALFPLRLRKVSDPMTGFFMVHRNKIDTTRLRPKGFKILMEILATHSHLTVTEVPLQFAGRNAGKSNGGLEVGLQFFFQLLNLRFGQMIRIVRWMPKFMQFGLIGGSVFGFGMALLYVLVEGFGWSPLVANALQLVVTFWLNYILNRNITWRERTVGRLAAHKFLASRAITTTLNYLLFAWLISWQTTVTLFERTFDISVNYLAANVITLLVITVLNYVITDRWAFAEPAKNEPTKSVWSRIPTSGYIAILLIALIDFSLGFNTTLTLSALLVIAGLLLFAQAALEVWRMVYTYREPDSVDRLKFPVPNGAKERFCIIVPARHESEVIAGTLHQLAKQTHPDVDILVTICDDDYDTLRVAFEVEAREPRVSVIQYPLGSDPKPNKPKQLNYAFNQVKDQGYTVYGVIDAEDNVHPELLMHIDAAFRDQEVGIVQGGVQLMNHDSSWYSLHNVLEYYRWFNSAMAFQADYKFMPLGGNTVFIRADLLRQAEGWPVTLTEDCALGVLLSARHQTKVAVHYEPWLATREETPDTLKALFKQRVRWNQGFFHEWHKGVWRQLPTFRQRMLASYVLLSPVILAAISLFMPISLLAALFWTAPVGLVMLMFLPWIPVSMLAILNAVFLRDFGQAFERKIRLRHYAVLIATHIGYQVVLNAAAFWSIVREFRGETAWYKSTHIGKHRVEAALVSEEGVGDA